MNIEKLKTFFRNDRFANLTGIEILEVAEGYCKAKLEIEDKHLNSANVGAGWRNFYPG